MSSMQKRDLLPTDILTHFLFFSSDINLPERAIKSSVLSKKHPNGFSVFETTGANHIDVWGVGKQYVAPSFEKHNPPRYMVGRYDIPSKYYTDASLTIELSEPPPKHYNIHGMPVSTSLIEAIHLSHRQVIVRDAKLYLIADVPAWSVFGQVS